MAVEAIERSKKVNLSSSQPFQAGPVVRYDYAAALCHTQVAKVVSRAWRAFEEATKHQAQENLKVHLSRELMAALLGHEGATQRLSFILSRGRPFICVSTNPLFLRTPLLQEFNT